VERSEFLSKQRTPAFAKATARQKGQGSEIGGQRSEDSRQN